MLIFFESEKDYKGRVVGLWDETIKPKKYPCLGNIKNVTCDNKFIEFFYMEDIKPMITFLINKITGGATK